MRPLLPSDSAAAFALIAAGRAAGGEPGAPAWTFEQVEGELIGGAGLGVFEEGDPARLEAFLLYKESGTVLEITYLMTAPRARRKGVMSGLLTEVAKGFARTIAARSEIWLDVHCENRGARALYARCGFTEVGRRPRYYPDGGDALLYSRPILSAK